MKNIFKGILLLILPAACWVFFVGFLKNDLVFRKIVTYELYVFGALGIAVSMIVIGTLAWQSLRAALYVLLKIDLRIKKNADDSEN
jgi:hypothetical protein